MNYSHELAALVAGSGVLLLTALLLVMANRRVSSPADRIHIRAAAWSLVSDADAHPNLSGDRTRRQEESVKGNA